MSRLRDAAVLVALLALLVASIFAAPMNDPMNTAAYVLLVETPLVALVALLAHAYIEWSTR